MNKEIIEEFEKRDLPMGVSQWKEHGKKYGYWKFFTGEFRKMVREKRGKKTFIGKENMTIPDYERNSIFENAYDLALLDILKQLK